MPRDIRKRPPIRSNRESAEQTALNAVPNRIEIPDWLRAQLTPQQTELVQAMLEFDLELDAKGWPSQPVKKRYAEIEEQCGKRISGGRIQYRSGISEAHARAAYPLLCNGMRDSLRQQAHHIEHTIRRHGFEPQALSYQRIPCFFTRIVSSGWISPALT